MPSHCNAALSSYPELNCDGVAPPLYTGIDVGFSNFCLNKEITFKFLDDVLGELADMTPGPVSAHRRRRSEEDDAGGVRVVHGTRDRRSSRSMGRP